MGRLLPFRIVVGAAPDVCGAFAETVMLHAELNLYNVAIQRYSRVHVV